MDWKVCRKTVVLCLTMHFLATSTMAQDAEEQFRIDVQTAFEDASFVVANNETEDDGLTDEERTAEVERLLDLAEEAEPDSGTTNPELWSLLVENGLCVHSPTANPPITCN